MDHETRSEPAPLRPHEAPPWVGADPMATTPVPHHDIVPARRRRRRRRRWPAVVAAVIALAGAGTFALERGADESHPKRWDPRIVDLVAFVERERGLLFEHPVQVDFLSDAAFRAEVTGTEELTEEDKAEIESAEAMLRAVGLLTEAVDLASIAEELTGDGTLGIYTFDDERIAVRGETLDNERRATLVHELTHALQDQRFGIGDMEPKTSGEDAALTAVVEADAEQVQAAWVETLSSDEQEALAAAEEKTSGGADFSGVPAVFLELTGFPYVLGPDFLDAVMEARGQQGRDEVLRRPPTTEEHILLPERYLAGERLRSVPTPALEAGETMIADSEGDFGMLSLLVVLGERLDFSAAWPAVQGWAGDAVVAFERGGTTCVRLAVAFDEAPQAERFSAAMTRWGGGLDTVAVAHAGDSVSVESCDPGPGRQAARAEGHVSGIQGLGLRQALVLEMEGFGVAAPQALCIVDGVLGRLGANRLAELDRAITENGNARAEREVTSVTAQVSQGCPE